MAASAADVINIDLEDSVAPGDKDSARANAVRAINEVDWGGKTLSVRINGLDSPAGGTATSWISSKRAVSGWTGS